MSYRLIISKPVQKQLDKLSRPTRLLIIEQIESLADVPRPHGCVKMQGFSDQYRIRVGDYRVWYRVNDKESFVEILRCMNRKDVYRP